MDATKKKNIAAGLATLATAYAIYAFYRLQRSFSDTANAKRWFPILLITLVIDLPLVLAYYYYRNVAKHPRDAEAIKTETLAQAGPILSSHSETDKTSTTLDQRNN